MQCKRSESITKATRPHADKDREYIHLHDKHILHQPKLEQENNPCVCVCVRARSSHSLHEQDLHNLTTVKLVLLCCFKSLLFNIYTWNACIVQRALLIVLCLTQRCHINYIIPHFLLSLFGRKNIILGVCW